jgi:hypothetical protein
LDGTFHRPISPKNGVGRFLKSAVSLKNMSMRFARVVATFRERYLNRRAVDYAGVVEAD